MIPKPFVYRALAPVALLAAASLLVLAALVLAGARRRAAETGHLVTAEARNAVFHVCTDPQRLPFSSIRRAAFESERRVRRELARATLTTTRCDAITGVPLRRLPASSR